MTTARIVRRLLLVSASAWGLSASATVQAADFDLLAALSPEQRQEMRDQVRENRQRQREERPDPGFGNREERGDNSRRQRLSPEDREEFRQWMRERHEREGRGGGGREGGGRGGGRGER